MVAANPRFQSNWFRNGGFEQPSMPTLKDIRQSAESTFEDYPLGVAFAAFGVGFAFGIAMTLMLSESETPHRRWS